MMAIRLCTVDYFYLQVNGEKWKCFVYINPFQIAKYKHIHLHRPSALDYQKCSNKDSFKRLIFCKDCESNRENSIIYRKEMFSHEALKNN